jgi:hypothetical protein
VPNWKEGDVEEGARALFSQKTRFDAQTPVVPPPRRHTHKKEQSTICVYFFYKLFVVISVLSEERLIGTLLSKKRAVPLPIRQNCARARTTLGRQRTHTRKNKTHTATTHNGPRREQNDCRGNGEQRGRKGDGVQKVRTGSKWGVHARRDSCADSVRVAKQSKTHTHTDVRAASLAWLAGQS